MLASFTRAARRAARDADLVHAHWLPAGAVAALTGKPFVVQLWGTDVELARRAPQLARRVLRRARLVIAPSTALAEAAHELGAREVRVVPSGIDLPPEAGVEDEPPHVLYAGRLSPEKGILDLVAAADGLPLVVVGDGPLRDQVPQAIGFLPNPELQSGSRGPQSWPSRRTARASASSVSRRWRTAARWSRRPSAVCATWSSTARPASSSRRATGPRCGPRCERLLADRELRARLGAAARERAATHFSWDRVSGLTLEAYEAALRLN